MSASLTSYPRRLAELARALPATEAVVVLREDGTRDTVTFAELDRWSRQLAQWLHRHGVGPATTVVVALPVSTAHYAASYAAWLLGACVLPVDPRAPAAERDHLLGLCSRPYLVSDVPAATADDPPAPPDVVANPGRAIASGGSTGLPKLIVDNGPHARVPGHVDPLLTACGLGTGTRVLLSGGLFHNVPFLWGHLALFEGGSVVALARFDASLYADAVETERPSLLPVVPTVMGRVARLADVHERDWSSVDTVLHTGSACPDWVKRAWFDLVGPERVVEAYGATESIGATLIRGDEWLERPGSVGRPFGCELEIRDDDGTVLPPGPVGGVWMRSTSAVLRGADYVGAPALPADDRGFRCVGDLGHLDDDGYLYLADRRHDLIVSGGANVYPAEVEAVLTEHPAVVDAAVVGLPDADWGQRVHAVVEVAEAVDPELLATYCRERLSPHKRPKSYEVVDRLPRNDAGKLRRAELVAARTGSSWRASA